jgi:hypothetical protein
MRSDPLVVMAAPDAVEVGPWVVVGLVCVLYVVLDGASPAVPLGDVEVPVVVAAVVPVVVAAVVPVVVVEVVTGVEADGLAADVVTRADGVGIGAAAVVVTIADGVGIGAAAVVVTIADGVGIGAAAVVVTMADGVTAGAWVVTI